MQDIELYIYDINFNRLAIIDVYEEVEFQTKYYGHSICYLTVEGNKKNADLLLVNEGELRNELRILVRSDDPNRGYIIETAQFEDKEKTVIEVIAYSLSIMTSWRWIIGQQRFQGKIEDVLKGFVRTNCINTSSPTRIIPNLVLGVNEGINILADESYTHKELDIALWEMCEKNEVSFEILMNHDAKKYVFSTYKGVNRSTEQPVNPHVIFAKEFENIISQSYTDDKSNFKSTAYVAGEGEDIDRTIIEVGKTFSGFDRREVFFDARDLQSEYKEDDTTITIPQNEYIALLQERGNNRKQDYQRIRTFESEANLYSQFKLNVDYFLGDIVTNRNDELGIVMHQRIVAVNEKLNREGYTLNLEYGTAIPTLLDKIKREVK
ncbi:siphovirus ReqiPepy6 Gp37-like family protein [Lysinibacillus xylanilyticus]|uniref:Siphovirus ReqiPepy6 Gp37-like family protein n=1 Tax=Lysinibacillus xylanilyticus TaxID=582475 RepID=A0ABT4ENQ4_9BACI|nr:siphovirus ReqiPepy6 Gp37-like family protein [Lysinibacillus xylanilyticus]MCY9547284.1 siphovirus ReqiPepy6 Gp37-like family protein [Lysinibacillus xylanilyticus]